MKFKFKVGDLVRHTNRMKGVILARVEDLAGVIMQVNGKPCEYPPGPGYLVKLIKGTRTYNTVLVSEVYLELIESAEDDDGDDKEFEFSDDELDRVADTVFERIKARLR